MREKLIDLKENLLLELGGSRHTQYSDPVYNDIFDIAHSVALLSFVKRIDVIIEEPYEHRDHSPGRV